MKKKNIKDTFESFSPSEEQQENIYESIINKQTGKYKRKVHFKIKLAYSVIACFILVSIAVFIVNTPISNNNATQPSKVNSLPSTSDGNVLFNGFILTAYAANNENGYLSDNYIKEAEKLVLSPYVKILLSKYSLAMSSVPGLPFTIDITDDENDIKTINVSTSSGELSKWDYNTGIVSNIGPSATIDIGETIYWSPDFNDNASDIKDITITVDALSNDTIVGRQTIYISQDETGYYYATVDNLKLL
ncbi:MAG: hypothetical protein R2876_07275 [Eubacteriales bacterium]